MLITDGTIKDFEETIDKIVESSSLPLSIIIVGVGDGDFSAMQTLDSDDSVLFSKNLNKHVERDIVAFIQFNKF